MYLSILNYYNLGKMYWYATIEIIACRYLKYNLSGLTMAHVPNTALSPQQVHTLQWYIQLIANF